MKAEMVMDASEHAFDIKQRTSAFAISVIKTVKALSRTEVNRVLGKQLLRSGTSIGANVAEAHAGFSRQDFAHAMNIARKEAQESSYWLNLLRQSESYAEGIVELAKECDDLCRILTTIVRKTQAPRKADVKP